MNRESSVEELAERTGEPVARLCECRSLGLIGSEDGEWFRPDDVERVRLIQLFLRRGIDLQTIAEAARGPVFSRLLSGYLDKFASGPAGATYSLADAADRLGLDVTIVRKFHEALGEPDDYLDEEEIEFMKGWALALESGLPEEAVVQLLRVYADALGRVGEAEVPPLSLLRARAAPSGRPLPSGSDQDDGDRQRAVATAGRAGGPLLPSQGVYTRMARGPGDAPRRGSGPSREGGGPGPVAGCHCLRRPLELRRHVRGDG